MTLKQRDYESLKGGLGTGWKIPLLRQLRHSWAISLLLGLALCGVVALRTYVRNSARFQNRSMQLIMKNMGHNLWFFDHSADWLDIASASPDVPAFSADRIHGLAADQGVRSTYWGNLLQGRIAIHGQDVLVTGLEVVDDHQVTEEKDHLFAPLRPGDADLGHTLARRWNLEVGDSLELDARRYRVRNVLPANGTLDDARLWIPLADAQDWLNKPGQANLILGFLCMSGGSLDAGIRRLEQRLAERHADLQVVPLMNLLNARALARMTTSRFLHYLLLAVMAVSVLLLSAVGWMEIHERRHELAILMAMGAGYGFVVGFFLAKLGLLALTAALAGFLLGSCASVHWLASVLVTHTQAVTVTWSDLPGTLALVLVLVGLAAIVPLACLARLDPTRILAEE